MKILAIETSCDETAICYIEAIPTDTGTEFTVHKNITHTQLEHKEFGGVFPMVAKREHQINLPIILDQIMQGREIPDYICVTNGPGLEPALWCGIVFAKELGAKWNIPVIPVNHMEGHILSVLVPSIPHNETVMSPLPSFSYTTDALAFPALALLISGGHTELVLARTIGDYEIIGKTKDDAVGEAFDKVARMMGLPYPGGPEIARLAKQYLSPVSQAEHTPNAPTFPRPMIHTKDFDFSFSGLKTAVLYHMQKLHSENENGALTNEQQMAIAHEFQEAAAEVLAKKTKKAIEQYGAQTLIIGGGVAANERIIGTLQQMVSDSFPETVFMAPAKSLTGDNALMIALAGYFKIQKNLDTQYPEIVAVGSLSF